jgi:glycosyltransferase involved in cell wall biosynthesis
MSWADVDVLHAHGEDWFLAGVDRPAHVRTVHGSGFAEARRIPGAKEKVRMVAIGAGEVVSSVLADRSVGVSEATRHAYPWLHEVIPCGVDLERFAAPPRPDPVPTILFVGTYQNRKRGRLVHEVFRDVIRPARPDARLWMVCTDAPPAPGVEVLGRLSDAELADRYRRAWVFTLPSTYEGFGVPYVEAMAAGCPVVATSNPGSEEVLDHGRYGRIVADGDLGASILELLDDESARRSMAATGREHSVRYGWDEVAAAYERVYDEALAVRVDRDRRTSGRRTHRTGPRRGAR